MATTAPERTTLALEGMTCAACATRIERALNRLDGVEATLPQPRAAASTIPSTSPIAQPVRQCSVACTALRVREVPWPCHMHP